MRIDALKITNYRGLKHAEISGLAAAPLVTVSGPNGSGKSLLFEAISLVGRMGLPPVPPTFAPLVGPYGDEAELQLSLALGDDETQALETYAEPFTVPPEAGTPTTVVLAARLHRNGSGELVANPWSQLLRHPDFMRRHPFSQIDYLPADRSFPRGEQASVNPALLGEEQREQFRQQIVNSFIQQRQMVSLSGIAPVLASLDYLDMLAEREDDASSGDFEAITRSFAQSTGKTIHRPRLDAGSPPWK
jgi:hypothetical protein